MLSPSTEALLREATDESRDPTEREYHLNCKVVIKEVSYADHQSTETKQVARKLVYLVPDESTQRNKFLDAWLPRFAATSDDVLNDPSASCEIVFLMGHPFKQPARGAVMAANHRCGEHHIYLMNLGLTQLLCDQLFDGRVVPVTVLPSSYDGPEGSAADSAIEGELHFEKKVYKNLPGQPQ